MTRTPDPWLGVGMSAWSRDVEASTLIGLRALGFAVGGTAGGLKQ